MDLAHQINEWVDVAELGAAAQTCALLAQRLLGSSVGTELTGESGGREMTAAAFDQVIAEYHHANSAFAQGDPALGSDHV